MKLRFKYFIIPLIVFLLVPAIQHIEADQFEIKEEIPFENDLKKSDLEGRIVFSVKLRDKNNYDLWIMDADGSNIRHLTDSKPNEINPSISPDGNYVAYAHDAGGDWRIGIMEIDSGSSYDITFCCEDQKNPDWGNNGIVAYQSNQEGRWGIWTKDPFNENSIREGAGRKIVDNVTNWDGRRLENDVKQPAWDDESNLLAFSTNRNKGNPENRINRIWFRDDSSGAERSLPETMVKQGDSPVFYKGSNWYPNANGLPVIAFVQINNERPTIRWSNINGSGGGKLTDKLKGNLRARNPKFGPNRSQEILAFLSEKNPNSGWKIFMWNIHDKVKNPVNVTPSSIQASINDFDWGPSPGSSTNRNDSRNKMEEQDRMNQDMMRKMQNDQKDRENEMRDEADQERIRANQERHERELKDERQRNEMNQMRQDEEMRMERERSEMQMESDRERMEMQMDADRERMEMERERMDEQTRMEQERMEQQRDMMKSMEGSGGRDDFFEPEERCFIEEEQSRGLFGNIEIGKEIDCGNTDDIREKLKDPTNLAMIGLVVTVGATLLQMFRGN